LHYCTAALTVSALRRVMRHSLSGPLPPAAQRADVTGRGQGRIGLTFAPVSHVPPLPPGVAPDLLCRLPFRAGATGPTGEEQQHRGIT
jgi:hypothetical protein